MNIRNCPSQVIRSFSLLNFKFNLEKKILFFTERTVKTQSGDLKSRIDKCQKDCASLKERFNTRLHVDTDIHVEEIKGGAQQTGTFLLIC